LLKHHPAAFEQTVKNNPKKIGAVNPLTASRQSRLTLVPAAKAGQLFIRTHNETLSIAMRVSNPNCSPVAIHG